MAYEFERVANQYDDLISKVDKVQFFGLNGLVRGDNQKISPFFFYQESENNSFFWIGISIPIIKTFDSVSLTFLMEYLVNICHLALCKNMSVEEAEIKAFDELSKLSSVRTETHERVPKEELSARIEVQISTKIKMGISVIPINAIKEQIKNELPFITCIEHKRKIRQALNAVKIELKNHSRILSTKYRINCIPRLFEIDEEGSFDINIIPLFAIQAKSHIRDLFTVIVVSEGIVDLLEIKELEILLAYEFLFNQSQDRFNRGEMEQEIFNIITDGKTDKLKFLVERELKKFYDLVKIESTISFVQEKVNNLIESNYPVIKIRD